MIPNGCGWVFFGTAEKWPRIFLFGRASEVVSDFLGAGAALSKASGAQAHPQAPWHNEERARFGETTKHVNLGLANPQLINSPLLSLLEGTHPNKIGFCFFLSTST